MEQTSTQRNRAHSAGKKAVTVRLSDTGHDHLGKLSAMLGVNKTAVIELALRQMAATKALMRQLP